MSNVQFTDSIDENLELLTMLLEGLPPQSRGEAKRAAVAVEKVITGIQRDGQGNPGAALGTAFAIYTFAQRFVEQGKESGKGNSLIQLIGS